MVSDRIEKVKEWCLEHKADLFTAAIIFLASMASFGLGRLSILWPQKEPIRILEKGSVLNPDPVSAERGSVPNLAAASAALPAKGKYAASKTGTSYHLPWCPGVAKIKESNKIWFQTKAEAESRGYKPAGNCSGL